MQNVGFLMTRLTWFMEQAEDKMSSGLSFKYQTRIHKLIALIVDNYDPLSLLRSNLVEV